MSDKDLNDELKQKNQMNGTRKSQDANSDASSFLDNENSSKILSKQELLKKIEAESRGIVDEDRVIINHRGKKNVSNTAPSSTLKNTRGQTPELNTSGIKNTRKKVPAEIPKATPTAKSTQNKSSTDLNMNNLSPELQAQFAKFLSQANNTPNFNNFNNFNPNAFNFPNFDPSQMPNFNPNDFSNFNPNDFGAGFDPNFNPNFDPNFNPDFSGDFNEPQQDTSINEQTSSQIKSPSGFKATPPPLPKKPIPPKQKPQEKTEEKAEINQKPAEMEELPTNEIPTDNTPISAESIEPEIERVEDIPPIEEIEELPNIEEPAQTQNAEQNQNNAEQSNNNSAFDFNFATQIPEHEQKDIRALVDIRLEQNIDEVIAATNVNDMSATLGQAAEDLIGNKMKRNVKGWLIVLGVLLLLVAVFAYFWDDIFGKKINEEEAAGLTITIIPSEGDKGSLDAKYIYYPGSEIRFQNGVRIGSELYRTEIREDGTEIQEENEAFAFRFRFFIEFTDEPGVEYQDLIESVVIPDEMQIVVKYDEKTGYYYYHRLVYPGEKYVPFANSIIINTSIQNEYQGREFQIVLDYSTIVPTSLDVFLEENMSDTPDEWQQEVIMEFQEWLKNA